MSWITKKISIHYHSNPVLLPSQKLSSPVMDLYGSQTYALKTRVDIWTRMGVVLAEYEILSQKFHLSMWFFKYIAGIEFRWDHTIWWIVAIPVCIGI